MCGMEECSAGGDSGIAWVAAALRGTLQPRVTTVRRRDGPASRMGRTSSGRHGVEYTWLGLTGLRVSRIGLGCMSYGNPAAGMHSEPWTRTPRPRSSGRLSNWV